MAVERFGKPCRYWAHRERNRMTSSAVVKGSSSTPSARSLAVMSARSSRLSMLAHAARVDRYTYRYSRIVRPDKYWQRTAPRRERLPGPPWAAPLLARAPPRPPASARPKIDRGRLARWPRPVRRAARFSRRRQGCCGGARRPAGDVAAPAPMPPRLGRRRRPRETHRRWVRPVAPRRQASTRQHLGTNGGGYHDEPGHAAARAVAVVPTLHEG